MGRRDKPPPKKSKACGVRTSFCPVTAEVYDEGGDRLRLVGHIGLQPIVNDGDASVDIKIGDHAVIPFRIGRYLLREIFKGTRESALHQNGIEFSFAIIGHQDLAGSLVFFDKSDDPHQGVVRIRIAVQLVEDGDQYVVNRFVENLLWDGVMHVESIAVYLCRLAEFGNVYGAQTLFLQQFVNGVFQKCFRFQNSLIRFWFHISSGFIEHFPSLLFDINEQGVFYLDCNKHIIYNILI